VPKCHIANLDALDDVELAGRLVLAVKQAAVAAGLRGAYRVGVNNGRAAGQVVEHLHFHVMGCRHGESFSGGGVEEEMGDSLA
jgi:histidine triad (HIT) family protein